MNLHRVSPSNIFDKKLKMDSLKFFRQKIWEHHLVPKVLTQIIKRSFLATILSDKFCCLNFFFFCTRGYLHITTTLTISSMASKCIINWRVSTSPYSNLIDKILKACNVASYKIFFSRLIYFFSYTGRI